MTDHDRTAALFMNGGSQAVRLPREFRFKGDAVRIWKQGNRVLLEPIEKAAWPASYWERLANLPELPDDFAAPPPLPASPHRDEVLRGLKQD